MRLSVLVFRSHFPHTQANLADVILRGILMLTENNLGFNLSHLELSIHLLGGITFANPPSGFITKSVFGFTLLHAEREACRGNKYLP